MSGLSGLGARLARLEQQAARGAVLRERKLGRVLRGVSDDELARLRALLVSDPRGAAELVARLEARAAEVAPAPTLAVAVQGELARRGDPEALRRASEWDSLTGEELAQLVGLLRAAEQRDGGLALGPVAERRVERLRRRSELRALLAVEVKACAGDRAGCSCLADALDEVDRRPELVRFGRRGVALLARRLHGRTARRRPSGAARRRRRRVRLAAQAAAARPAPVGALPRRSEAALAPVVEDLVSPDEGAVVAEPEPEPEPVQQAAPRLRARSSPRSVPAGRVARGSRESDAAFVERVFGLPAGAAVDVSAAAPPESALHLLRGARGRPR